MTKEQKTFDVLYDAGLCWSVTKEETYTKDGIVTGAYCTRRSDTGAVLGAVGSRYLPMQNETLVDEFITATEQIGLTDITGKCIDGGRKILLKARIGDVTIGNDTVKRFITVSNTHDGSSQVLLGSHSVVQVCSNGLTREINQQQLGIVKHTTNAGDKMNWYIRNLPKVIKAEEDLMTTFKKMSEIQVNKEHIKRVIEKLYEVNMEDMEKEVSTRKKNMIRKFDETLHTNGLNVHGNTLWGLLQTVTFIISHDKDGKVQEEKGMIGKGMEMGNMTYDMLVEFINNPVKETVFA